MRFLFAILVTVLLVSTLFIDVDAGHKRIKKKFVRKLVKGAFAFKVLKPKVLPLPIPIPIPIGIHKTATFHHAYPEVWAAPEYHSFGGHYGGGYGGGYGGW